MIKPKNKPKKTAKQFAEELSEKMRTSFEKLKFEPSQVAEVHNNLRKMTAQFDTPGPNMSRIVDFTVPSNDIPVPVRLYIPHGVSEEPGPTFIYFHGGGFVTGSIESHEGITRRVASGTGYRVLSVEYRLAPQHPFPAGPDDCETVLKWAMEGGGLAAYGIDPNCLAIGGDSAGGNMAAYMAQKYRKNLKAQILFYPLMQLIDFKPPKPGPQDWLQIGFMALKFIDEHYIGGADTRDTRLSPLLEDDLEDIPPTYVLTCGLDPLRDEGKLYADRLAATGAPVVYFHEKMMPHGFLNFAKMFPKGRKIPLEAADFLRQHMETPKG